MDIVVLAGGLSTERDVSFKTGSMVAAALKENGHRVILLDVFMGYSDKEENLDGIFDRADAISRKSFKKRPVSLFLRTKCHSYVPDGRHCVYGFARRERRERKASGSI